MKLRTVALIGAIVIIVMSASALAACAVFPVQPSQEPVPFTQLSPLAPTAAAVVLPSPLRTPVAAVASSPLPTPMAGVKLAPDFTLSRENGQTVCLSDLRDKSSVVLVFYRGQT